MCSLIPLSIMKKLFLLLLVLSGVSLATAAQSITLGNYITDKADNSIKCDAFNALKGKTEEQVADTTGIQMQSPYMINKSISVKLKTDSMIVSVKNLEEGTRLSITELAFIAHTDSKYQSIDSTASLTVNGFTYVSEKAIYDDDNVADTYNVVRYTFSDSLPTFVRGEELNFTLMHSGESDENQLGIGGFRTTMSTDFPQLHGANVRGVFQITALIPSLIPEPGSTTLSVLTLAFLTLRRRRG